MLQSIIQTLGEIEVKGEDNMSKLLGCIYALKSLAAETPENTEKEEVTEDGR